jgi:hypothetical protein
MAPPLEINLELDFRDLRTWLINNPYEIEKRNCLATHVCLEGIIYIYIYIFTLNKYQEFTWGYGCVLVGNMMVFFKGIIILKQTPCLLKIKKIYFLF